MSQESIATTEPFALDSALAESQDNTLLLQNDSDGGVSSDSSDSSDSEVDVDNKATQCFNKTKSYMYHAFNDHPIENGMTYSTHFVHAWTSGFKSLTAGTVLLIHGLFPFAFEKTGSSIIKGVNYKLNNKIKKTE